MPSSVAWMDTSARELRQAQEIIQLFQQKEGRDELGIGTVRDALSNLLFPGTSVLQTRARYYLFVPWIYQRAAASGSTGRAFDEKCRAMERDLVERLIAGRAGDGIIGARVGRNVQNLPSALYWNGMHSYGIVNARRASDIALQRNVDEMSTELAHRSAPAMASLPKQPSDFPEVVSDGFALRAVEAQWLREHIVTRHHGTPLALLLEPARVDPPYVEALRVTPSPWTHPAIGAHPAVQQARLFSAAMQGAALLYNQLVGEYAGSEGYEEKSEWTLVHFERLAEWQGAVADDPALLTWRTTELWDLLEDRAVIPLRTKQFVDAWVHGLQMCLLEGRLVAEDPVLRGLVSERERRKGAQSRLTNPKMLSTWSGEAGTGALLYRWANVRTLLVDILEGLSR